ncbi:hypothetical protein DPEC_G00365400 [Dallia pectoralis]|nr:hypothetical protein DPEC_G00365400 [Dallia pectoralis]
MSPGGAFTPVIPSGALLRCSWSGINQVDEALNCNQTGTPTDRYAPAASRNTEEGPRTETHWWQTRARRGGTQTRRARASHAGHVSNRLEVDLDIREAQSAPGGHRAPALTLELSFDSNGKQNA